MVFQKSRFGWVWLHVEDFIVSGPMFTRLFLLNVGWIEVDHLRPILNIVIHFADICLRILKFEIGPNIARFWPLKYLWRRPPQNFGLALLNSAYYWSSCKISHQLVDRAQRSRIEKKKINKTSAVKHKSAPKAIAFGQTIGSCWRSKFGDVSTFNSLYYCLTHLKLHLEFACFVKSRELHKDKMCDKTWLCFGNTFIKMPKASAKHLLEKGFLIFSWIIARLMYLALEEVSLFSVLVHWWYLLGDIR